MLTNRTVASGFLLATALVAHASVVVNDGVIVMADDGWYQVQSTSDYQTICEGVTECRVDAGVYIVINHTTGERITVTVEEPTTPPDTGGIRVDGNTISWPDDGWYQVQNEETYESVCEGGRSCEVEPGSYVAINLTTGTRHPDIVVAGEAVADNPLGVGEHITGPTQRFNRNYHSGIEGYFIPVFSYKSPLPQYFAEIAAGHFSRVMVNGTIISQNQKTDDSGGFNKIETVAEYECDAGGTLTYRSSVSLMEPFATDTIDETALSIDFYFSECHSEFSFPPGYPWSQTGIFPFGEYTLNGSYRVNITSPTPSGYFSKTVEHSWDQLYITAEAPSQWSLKADGSSNYRYYSRRSRDTEFSGKYEYSLADEEGYIIQQTSGTLTRD